MSCSIRCPATVGRGEDPASLTSLFNLASICASLYCEVGGVSTRPWQHTTAAKKVFKRRPHVSAILYVFGPSSESITVGHQWDSWVRPSLGVFVVSPNPPSVLSSAISLREISQVYTTGSAWRMIADPRPTRSFRFVQVAAVPGIKAAPRSVDLLDEEWRCGSCCSGKTWMKYSTPNIAEDRFGEDRRIDRVLRAMRCRRPHLVTDEVGDVDASAHSNIKGRIPRRQRPLRAPRGAPLALERTGVQSPNVNVVAWGSDGDHMCIAGAPGGDALLLQ